MAEGEEGEDRRVERNGEEEGQGASGEGQGGVRAVGGGGEK